MKFKMQQVECKGCGFAIEKSINIDAKPGGEGKQTDPVKYCPGIQMAAPETE